MTVCVCLLGTEKDSEGFYFKGDTSVPCYRREELSIPPEDEWDRGTVNSLTHPTPSQWEEQPHHHLRKQPETPYPTPARRSQLITDRGNPPYPRQEDKTDYK